jgi:hypothetical protein
MILVTRPNYLKLHKLTICLAVWHVVGNQACGRTRTLTDSERKMNRSEVSSKWNKCRINVGDQLDRWNELKEVLRIQTCAEFANILLDR